MQRIARFKKSINLGPSYPDDGSTVGFRNEVIFKFQAMEKVKKGDCVNELKKVLVSAEELCCCMEFVGCTVSEWGVLKEEQNITDKLQK